MGAENPASRMQELETNLAHVRGELAAQRDHTARLISTLREAREQIVTLKQELDRLAQPPNGYGTFISRHEDNTIDISLAGRKMRVTASPTIDVEALRPGQELVVNEAMNVVDVREFESVGEIVTLKERLSDGRALVVGHTDDEFASPEASTASSSALATRCCATSEATTPSSECPRQKSRS
jgi:proteasome-associated ATPase